MRYWEEGGERGDQTDRMQESRGQKGLQDRETEQVEGDALQVSKKEHVETFKFLYVTA